MNDTKNGKQDSNVVHFQLLTLKTLQQRKNDDQDVCQTNTGDVLLSYWFSALLTVC